MNYGKHIELFLVDGEAGGITTADVTSWTGHILSGPRSRLSDLLAREEAHRNGVYLLLGDDSDAIDNTNCYIGKTEDFSSRFVQHDKKRHWWDRTVLISSGDDSFNEGHWGYIEARLVEIARRAERSSLIDNKQTPQPRKLSEAQRADAEAFIAEVRTVLPVLGVNVLKTRPAKLEAPAASFEQPVVVASPSSLSSAGTGDVPTFVLAVQRRRIRALAQVAAGEFIVLEGSIVSGAVTGKAAAETTQRSYDALKARFDKLVADGSIVVSGKTGTLTRDLAFASPSAAGALVTGRACNGREAWRLDNGLTYGAWEERGADIAQPAASSVS